MSDEAAWHEKRQQLAAANARIAELEQAVREVKHVCPWMGKWATERRERLDIEAKLKGLAESWDAAIANTEIESSQDVGWSEGLSLAIAELAAIIQETNDE